MSGADYNAVLSYLNATARTGLNAAAALNGLGEDSPLPVEDIPKNYFLRSKDPLTDRYLVKFSYKTINSETGKPREWSVLKWVSDIQTIGETTDALTAIMEEFLGWVNADNTSGVVYRFDTSSISFVAIYQR